MVQRVEGGAEVITESGWAVEIFFLLVGMASVLGGIISGLVCKSFFNIETNGLYKAQQLMIDKHYEYESALYTISAESLRRIEASVRARQTTACPTAGPAGWRGSEKGRGSREEAAW